MGTKKKPDPAPEPEKRKTPRHMIFRVEDDFYDAVRAYCDERGISYAFLARELLRAVVIEGGEVVVPS